MAGRGKCVHVQATGNTKISVCAENRVHVSHLILLIYCAVILAIPLPVCLSPPHLHMSNSDLESTCLCFPKSLHPNKEHRSALAAPRQFCFTLTKYAVGRKYLIKCDFFFQKNKHPLQLKLQTNANCLLKVNTK